MQAHLSVPSSCHMANSSVGHLAFYPHFNGPRDHSRACEAFGWGGGGIPKAAAFTL